MNTDTHSNTNSIAFTLIEVLIALFIFAVIGILTASSLHTMIRLHDQLKIRNQQITKLDMTMTLLRRDIMEMINRPVRDGSDYLSPALTTDGDGLTFTKTGLFNPFAVTPQSDMQRIAYTLDGSHLVRLTWRVLDQPPQSMQMKPEKPQKMILLNDVDSIKWQFVADNNSESNSWPPAAGSNLQRENAALPKAIIMVMKTKQGVIEGVFPTH